MADTARLNKEYFDKEASVYESKHEKSLSKLVEEIRARKDFIGAAWADEDEDDDNCKPPKRAVRLLDYACGTGMVSRALGPFVTQCVGVDISEGMVAAYNARASNQGLSPAEMSAHLGDLCSPDGADPPPASFARLDLADFDVAAVGLALHHMADPALAARRLAERLRPGAGVLLVIDFLPHEPMQHHHHHHGHGDVAATVTHHGFSEARMRDIFEQAGVGDGFAFAELGDAVSFFPHRDHGEDGGDGEGKAEVRRRIFMARGRRRA